MQRPAVDYHREKYGLVALANHLTDDGWEVMLSVDPGSLRSAPVKGLPVPVIDADRDASDPRYKYSFYVDRGGLRPCGDAGLGDSRRRKVKARPRSPSTASSNSLADPSSPRRAFLTERVRRS